MSEIQIYVACLAAYNNGYLHGAWIDATQDVDDIQDHINKMLESSPVEDPEEYAIHDFEGFGSYRLSEYEGIESAHEGACFITTIQCDCKVGCLWGGGVIKLILINLLYHG